MSEVFISYSSLDKRYIETLSDLLEKKEIKCWYAPRNIILGTEWAGCISEAIRNCSFLVLIYSKNSDNSIQVPKEALLAKKYKKQVIFLEIEKVMNSKLLKQIDTSDVIWIDGKKNKMIDNNISVYKELCKMLKIKEKEIHIPSTGEKTILRIKKIRNFICSTIKDFCVTSIGFTIIIILIIGVFVLLFMNIQNFYYEIIEAIKYN